MAHWRRGKFKDDIYKKINHHTNACLIHKHFDKVRATCPVCDRCLTSFGSRTQKVKKGDKKAWKAFILAKAWPIWNQHKDDFPCEDTAWIVDSPAKSHSEKDEALKKWVLKFDKFLRTLE